ncbi:MAG: tryptophan 2,3-dioxygenase family protein [Candidatus Eremiobacterota bacterium]
MSTDADAPTILATAELTYQDYLRVPDLLSLQVPRSDPPAHDEMLFIIIHQAFELWFKQMLHEMESALASMERDRILRAQHHLARVVKIMRLLVQQVGIIETMATAEFLLFRDRLNPASGFQSIQFREIEYLAGVKDARYLEVFKNRPEFREVLARRLEGPDLSDTFQRLMLRHASDLPAGSHDYPGHEDPHQDALMKALLKLYEHPDSNLRLYLLSESLVELDEAMAQWRYTHVLMVERVIGFRRGTGGSSGVRYLESTLSKRCFPYLWEVRTYLQKL